MKKTNKLGMRDFNIITNRYVDLHDHKERVDQEVERVEAAKKYWETHDFNPININYYDPDKEE